MFKILQPLSLVLLQNTDMEKINRSRILSPRYYTLKHLELAHITTQEVTCVATQEVTLYVAAQEVTCCGARSDICCCS